MLETVMARPSLLLGLLPAALTLGCYFAARLGPAPRRSFYRWAFFIGPPMFGVALVVAMAIAQSTLPDLPGIPDHILILGLGGYTTIWAWVLLSLVNFRHLLSAGGSSPANG